MSDREHSGPSPDPTPPQVLLRPLTKQLVEAIALDAWPGNAAVVDFGLDSQEHYEALYYPVRNGEITPAQLEAALGKGPKLTELANNAPSNPHKGIVFSTSWDGMHISTARDVFDAAVEIAYIQSKPEQLGGLTLPAPEQGVTREAYAQDMEEKHWGSWQETAYDYNIGQLHEMAGDYHDRLEAMQELNEGPWKYRIEAYRPAPSGDGWTPAAEAEATVWFGFRERGEDHRCFGLFQSRGAAEKAASIIKERDEQPEPLADEQRPEGYHASQDRNGTEDEITIHAPDGREMAHIWFWDEEHDLGDAIAGPEAKVDGQHIVAALNAYASRSEDVQGDRTGALPGYHTSTVRNYIWESQDAVIIHAPGGRHMAFIELPDEPGADHSKIEADAQHIVNALNSYQRQKTSVLGYQLAAPSPAPAQVSRLAELLGVPTQAPTPEPEPAHDRGRGGR